MDVNALIAALTDGLPAEQATVVRQAIERDAVKAKAAGWRNQEEYEEVATKLNQALPYQNWYAENYGKVENLGREHQTATEALRAYEQKFGKLDQATPPPAATAKGLTPEEVQAEVDKRIRDQYASRWSNIVVNTGRILQKHLMSGRKTEVDLDKLAEEANKNYNGDLQRAYDEWDKPERERIAAENQEKEINRRVEEELRKRGTSTHFPVKEDTSGALSARAKEVTDKFDKSALSRELTDVFISAGNGDTVQ